MSALCLLYVLLYVLAPGDVSNRGTWTIDVRLHVIGRGLWSKWFIRSTVNILQL